MGDHKTLCKWGRKRIGEELDAVSAIVGEPAYVCSNCARAACDERFLCRPTPLAKLSAGSDSRGKRKADKKKDKADKKNDKADKKNNKADKKNDKADKKNNKADKKNNKADNPGKSGKRSKD